MIHESSHFTVQNNHFFFIYLTLRERQYHIKDLFHEQTKCFHINFTNRGKMLVNFFDDVPSECGAAECKARLNYASAIECLSVRL